MKKIDIFTWSKKFTMIWIFIDNFVHYNYETANNTFYINGTQENTVVDADTFLRYQYVVACHNALNGYTPITTEAQDGVDNALTESNVDDIIDNIEKITGLHFLPKETTYNTNNWNEVAYVVLALNSGANIDLNHTPTAQELLDQPHLGTGTLQLFTQAT